MEDTKLLNGSVYIYTHTHTHTEQKVDISPTEIGHEQITASVSSPINSDQRNHDDGHRATTADFDRDAFKIDSVKMCLGREA